MNFVEFIISNLIEIYMLFIMLFCYKKMSNKKLIINLRNLLIITIFSILLITNSMYSSIYFKLLISIILNIFLNKIIFKSSLKETIKYTIIYFIIAFLIELLLVVFSSILKNNIININDNIIIKNIFSIISPLIILSLFSNSFFINLINKVIVSTKMKINYIEIVTITIIFLNIITILLTKNLNNRYIVFLAISSILFIILCYNIIINDKYHISELKELNNNLKLSHKAYSSTIDECRELKHNLKNDLLTIKSLIPNKYQDCINELLLKYNKKYEWISKIDDIPEGIQGVIYLKSNEAKKKKIKMYIDVKDNIKEINKDYFSLCSVLGIVLDNAIENCSKSKGKTISVFIKNIGNELNIEVINVFSNKVDLDKIGNKNYSTKKIKSGIGLNYIKKLRKKNLSVNYNIINNLFITKIHYKY